MHPDTQPQPLEDTLAELKRERKQAIAARAQVRRGIQAPTSRREIRRDDYIISNTVIAEAQVRRSLQAPIPYAPKANQPRCTPRQLISS